MNLEEMIDEVSGNNKYSMRRDRLYDGQPHTDTGERGQTEIKGITFRDLRDCFIRAVMLSAAHIQGNEYEEALKGENARISANDLFSLNLNDIDPMAVAQNLSCEVEKIMGIFPNV